VQKRGISVITSTDGAGELSFYQAWRDFEQALKAYTSS